MKWNQIQKQISTFFSDLDFPCTLTKRELILGAIACFSTGMVLGLLSSPNKTVTMGSYNGSYNGDIPTEQLDLEEE